MNAMLPGQNPLQQHMKWAAERQREFLERQREQAGYEEWKRRRQGKKAVGAPAPPPPPPPWSGATRVPLAPGPVPTPGPRVDERRHPVRALFTLVVMLLLTAVAVTIADLALNGMVALVLAGGAGLVVTVIATRSAWRDR